MYNGRRYLFLIQLSDTFSNSSLIRTHLFYNKKVLNIFAVLVVYVFYPTSCHKNIIFFNCNLTIELNCGKQLVIYKCWVFSQIHIVVYKYVHGKNRKKFSRKSVSECQCLWIPWKKESRTRVLFVFKNQVYH